jgi:hypothetical protein
MPDVSGRTAMTESYPNAEQVDWHYKAANYYHKAVSYLRTSLHDKQTRSTLPCSALDDYPELIDNQYMTGSDNHSTLFNQDGSLAKESHDGWDEFLAGASILSGYEFLDGNRDGFAL